MSAPGATNLSDLIKYISPSLSPTTFVFAHVKHPESLPLHQGQHLTNVAEMLFREHEGWTLILSQSIAHELRLQDIIYPCRKITLNVQSSLDAVGFLAAVTTRLAKKLSIGVNPVSGYLHDHLFVPLGSEEKVIKELEMMAAEYR